jgi:hypothetical protein
MVYGSPLDFTAVFNATDSLTITFPAGATFIPADAEDILWLGIRWTNALGQDVFLDNSTYKYDYESGTNLLTVSPDPGFEAGGEYLVELLGPPRDEALLTAISATLDALDFRAGFGSMGLYMSPIDFTATRHDADELNFAGMPNIPDKAQFLGVIEKVDGTIRQKWIAGDEQFEWDAANKRLQIVGATFSVDATAEWIAWYFGQPKGFDPVLNAIQQVQINARPRKFVEEEELWDATTIAGTLTSIYIDVKGQTWLAFHFSWTTDNVNGVYSLFVTPFQDPSDTGTAKHQVFTGDWAFPNTPAATITVQGSTLRVQATVAGGVPQTVDGVLRLRVNALNRVCFDVSETPPGGGADGEITASATHEN